MKAVLQVILLGVLVCGCGTTASAEPEATASSTISARVYIFSGRRDPPPWSIISTNHISDIRSALANLKEAHQTIPSNPPYIGSIELVSVEASGVPKRISMTKRLVRVEADGKVKWLANDARFVQLIIATVPKNMLPSSGTGGRNDVIRFLTDCLKACKDTEKEPNQAIDSDKK